MKINNRTSGSLSVIALAVVGVLFAGIVTLTTQFKPNVKNNAQVLSESSTEFTISSPNAVANQDGSSLTLGPTKAWYGTAQSTSSSYLGLNFTGGQIPAGAQIKSATLEVTAVGSWISVSSIFYGDTSKSGDFSSSNKPSSRSVTSSSKAYSDNVKWNANSTYSFDVTALVQELVGTAGSSNIGIIAKGSGGQWGRKEFYGNPSTGKSPKLVVVFVTGSVNTSSSPTTTATATATATARATATATATASSSPLATATADPGAGAGNASASPSMTMSASPSTSPQSGTIFGTVGADLLGTCTAAVHDRYITVGPDGKTYRTWHPTVAPIDANNPSGPKCTFAHEHGDNPATSNIFRGAVPFNYVPSLIGMEEPHAGFKCFVHNKGTVNDEGGTMLHDSYYCFHMGTGGAARFTTRFHSLDMHVVTSGGARFDVNGLADVGEVGTICNNPRQQRTVMGMGCMLDSAYEIWENRFSINNKGNTVLSTVASTAVFDSITVMDPADKTKLVYVWDPLAKANIFKFGNDRSSYRGCDREAYSGPVSWYNAGGSQVYYTDVYGNVVDNGPVKQFVSNVNTKSAGPLTQFGGLIMAYKGGNEPQTQFKYHKSACVSGLGLKN